MYNLLDIIPGLQKITFKRKFGLDLLFFACVIALPTSFFNFLPDDIFLDVKSVYLLVGIIYILFNLNSFNKLLKIQAIKILLLVVLFLVFRLLYSYLIDDINLIEIITIFRTNFSYPIITFGFLLYAVKMDNTRIYRFFYWLFFTTLILGTIYIISNLSTINVYANIYKDYRVFNDTLIIQNMASIPRYSKFLFVFGLTASITVLSFRKYHYIVVPFIVTIISIVRSELIVYLVSILLILFFTSLTRFKFRIGRIIKFSIIGMMSLGIVIVVFSSHYYRLVDKFEFNEKKEISSQDYIEEGTYKVRLDLIANAQKAIKKNPLLGNGYQREVRKGQYSYVVGGDTFIAPVLYAEGYLGLILRFLPIFFFIRYGIQSLRSKSQYEALIAIILLTIIMSEFLNIVQTRLFVFYNEIVLLFYFLLIINHNYGKVQLVKNDKT